MRRTVQQWSPLHAEVGGVFISRETSIIQTSMGKAADECFAAFRPF